MNVFIHGGDGLWGSPTSLRLGTRGHADDRVTSRATSRATDTDKATSPTTAARTERRQPDVAPGAHRPRARVAS